MTKYLINLVSPENKKVNFPQMQPNNSSLLDLIIFNVNSALYMIFAKYVGHSIMALNYGTQLRHSITALNYGT